MDQTRDLSGREFYRLTNLYAAPDFVKAATAADLCGAEDLPPEAFGDPRRRLFPCHNASATWASMAFFLDKTGSFKSADAKLISDRIEKMGEFHRIAGHLTQLKTAVAGNVATEDRLLPDDSFGLVYKSDGQAVRRYPMRNSMEVKTAAEYLQQHRDSFPFMIRRDFADKVLQKTAEFGVGLGNDLHQFIVKQAGHGGCTAAEAVQLIRDRVAASRRGPGPNSDLQTEMLKFANIFAEHPSRIREAGVRVKVAEAVDAFDREMGLKDFGPRFPRLEEVLFGITNEKLAEVTSEHVDMTTGSIFALRDIERVKLGEVRDYFGDGFADRMTSDGIRVDGEKAATFLKTLPRNDAGELERFMSGYGIMPMAKQASARTVKIAEEYLQNLARGRQAAGA